MKTSASNPLPSDPFGVPGLPCVIASIITRLLGLHILQRWYQSKPQGLSTRQFCQYTLSCINVSSQVTEGTLDNVPAEGPLVIVANHPFGGIEGVLLLEHLLGRRSDLKVLTNRVLSRIPEFSNHFIPVDVFHSGNNRDALRHAETHVANGGALLVFPAGEVSSFQWRQRRIVEADWRPTAARIAQKYKASVSPLFIEGHNRLRFHLVGLLHPLLRTLLLPREMLARQNTTIRLRIGRPIQNDELVDLNRDQANAYLRLNTLLLGRTANHRHDRNETPIAQAIPAGIIQEELSRQTPILIEKHYRLYLAESQALTQTLQEIGRLREIAFRKVGEGTGTPRDLDQYDQWYQHLLLWDELNKKIVGAYRVGMANRIVSERGLKGLYTYSLFKFDSRFLHALEDPIEVGRSFVNPDYQRNPRALFLLWKGIAHFIRDRKDGPGILFGPVSISADYHPAIRRLMARALSWHHGDAELKRIVQPRCADNGSQPPLNRDALSGLGNLKRLSTMILRLEENKRIPVLLRHYLGLNGRLIAFNLDPAFNDSLDGLIVVDLRNTNQRVLQQYMGKNGANDYLDRHKGCSSNVK